MLKMLICQGCLENLDEYGEAVHDLYVELCEYYSLMSIPFEICLDRMPFNSTIVRFLEYKGYVVSTETSVTLTSIMPRHRFIENNYIIFCAHKEKDLRLDTDTKDN